MISSRHCFRCDEELKNGNYWCAAIPFCYVCSRISLVQREASRSVCGASVRARHESDAVHWKLMRAPG